MGACTHISEPLVACPSESGESPFAQTLDQFVVSSLFESEHDLRAVCKNWPPDETRLFHHHLHQLVVCGLAAKLSIRLGARASPCEHFVYRGKLAQFLYLIERQLLFEKVAKFVTCV